MKWYESPNIECIGFPYKVLPYIGKAIENNQILWLEREFVGFNLRGTFKWIDCEWKIREMNNSVQSITLVEGNPTCEDLTAAVLRG